MPVVNMTDRWVAGASPQDGKRTDYSDHKSRSLYLRVTASHVKSWAVVYRRQSDGKQRRLTLGRYPELTLADARERAQKIMVSVAEGQDPAGQKQERKQADTFAELADLYLERHAKPNKRSWREDEKMLKHDLLPHLGAMKADQIIKRDFIRTVDIVADRGATIRANRVLGLARCIYNWANAEDLLDGNPTLGIRKRGREEARDRILSDAEVRTLWHGLERSGITPAVQTILRLALLTGQRIGEVAGADRDEISLEKALWEIPGSRTKNKKPHTVPLSPWVLALLRAAINNAGDSPFVFPSPTTRKPITALAPSKALRRERETIGIEGIRVHDLRRTVASNMAQMGIERVTVGKVLNHASVDGASITGRVYDRYSYDREKRWALEAWADRLRAIVEGRELDGNVVEFNVKR